MLPARVLVALLLLSAFPLLPGCEDDEGRKGVSESDRGLVDGDDLGGDLFPADLPGDAGRDLPEDSGPDLPGDGPLDPGRDQSADTPLDLAPDLPPDGPACIEEGESGEVGPLQAECCEGLEPIGCELPDDNNRCPDEPCVGAFVCARCGDGHCGPGENSCNCPADCGGGAECVDEGEEYNELDDQDARCCEGLGPVVAAVEINGDCAVPQCPCFVCVSCGDGPCGPGENRCNCPEDCGGQGGCSSNDDCPGGWFCERMAGECEGLGQCLPRPQECIEVLDPVCGCDEVSHDNDCFRQAAGVSLLHDGPCEEPPPPDCEHLCDCRQGQACMDGRCVEPQGVGTPFCCDNPGCPEHAPCLHRDGQAEFCGGQPGVCFESDDCDEDSFCEKDEGNCMGPGDCMHRPLDCPHEWSPVCGCDGLTHHSNCARQAAGVAKQYDGQCRPECIGEGEIAGDVPGAPPCCGGLEPIDCSQPGMGLPCIECERAFVCAMCGDGQCKRGENSCNCPEDCGPQHGCFANRDCPDDQFCEHLDGECNGWGTCVHYPPVECPDVEEPLCGCDGQTYANNCTRQHEGVSILHSGVCGDCVARGVNFQPWLDPELRCCQGLVGLSSCCVEHDGICECPNDCPVACLRCGNGRCEEGEEICNCPVDCE